MLDVGAGDGFISRRLANALPADARVTCWDANYTDAHLASEAFAPGERLRFTRAVPEGTFGLALLLDVLEHVEDDLGFLREVVVPRLAPGAHALVSVPAWPALFSSHDVKLRHHRRYTPRATRAVVEGAGLEVVRAGGLFHALLLPRAAQVVLERARRRSERAEGPRRVERARPGLRRREGRARARRGPLARPRAPGGRAARG